MALKINLLADCHGGDTVNLAVAFLPKSSVTSTVAVPACVTVNTFVAEFPLMGETVPKLPKVLANQMVLAPGAETTTCLATLVTMVKSFAGSVVMDNAPTAALTVNANEFAFPNAVTVICVGAAFAFRPVTVAVALPEELVHAELMHDEGLLIPINGDRPSTVASVVAKVTGTPANATPLALLTKAVRVTALPPAVKVVPAELETVNVAPLI